MKTLILLFAVLAFCSQAQAQSEADYVDSHCKGHIEYLLPDLTRIDCLLPDHAVEYDFGHKWAEAIGQSLHYAANTGRRAGIVFIQVTNSDIYGIERARRLIRHYGLPIDITDVITQTE